MPSVDLATSKQFFSQDREVREPHRVEHTPGSGRTLERPGFRPIRPGEQVRGF